MTKDLTNSQIDRQNILNNSIALEEIQNKGEFRGILWHGELVFTKNMIADFFEVDERTIDRYLNRFYDELILNGYEILKGKKLKDFFEQHLDDINVVDIKKAPSLGMFNFKALLNLAMLLSESEKAKLLRQFMLDVVIDVLNRKVGGGTKYVNQLDKDYIFSALEEEQSQRKFVDAINECVIDWKGKITRITDMVYQSIFREKAHEYREILDLQKKEPVRDTLYSEVLDLVATYESIAADKIREQFKKTNTPLDKDEVKRIIEELEPFYKVIISRARAKMASRDLVFREAYHDKLTDYIIPLEQQDFDTFLNPNFELLLKQNQDVLKRLKERE